MTARPPSPSRRPVLTVLSVGTALWLFLTLSWYGLAQTDVYKVAASRWREAAGVPGGFARLALCVALTGCLYLALRSRRTQSLRAAALIGLLMALISSAMKLSLGSEFGIDGYVLLRESILALGLMLAAVTLCRIHAPAR